ncbi:MAG: hypothetical protein JWP94_545 [Mucilaginibacter sp.]|nr:hypothetical protein [Mucilaginibacter sp.]
MSTDQPSEKFRDDTVLVIYLICIFLFLYTGYSKIEDHSRFLNGLSRVSVISPFAVYLSWIVPIAEIITAILLVIPKTIRWGLYAFTFLMTLFTIYIASMVLWATKLPCHCGGAIEKLSWTQHIWFNLALIVISVFALWLSKLKTNF